MIVTVTADPSVERAYQVDGLQVGAVNRADRVLVEPGGKGVNVSRVLGVLGVPSRAVVTAGGREGQQLLDLLVAAGIAAVPVPVAGATRVNATVLADEPTAVCEPGTALSAEEQAALLAAVREELAGADWVACCGSLPAGTDPLLVRRIIAAARENGVKTAVDAGGAALRVAVRARPDLVAPDAAELAELTGRAVTDVDQAVSAALEVCGRTGGEVLVGLGAHGAVLVSAAGAWHGAGPRVAAANGTGAGDALLAGYLGAGGGPVERLAAAVATATAACLAAGAAEPSGAEPAAEVTVRPVVPSQRSIGTG